MSALRLTGAITANASASSLAEALGELEQAHASRGAELSPELVRLGAAWPEVSVVASAEARTAIPGEALEAIVRIGAHLGRLERAIVELPPSEGLHVADRLARARVLVDCAAALAALRASVHEALRTARPA
jgi:hypothetical protein